MTRIRVWWDRVVHRDRGLRRWRQGDVPAAFAEMCRECFDDAPSDAGARSLFRPPRLGR